MEEAGGSKNGSKYGTALIEEKFLASREAVRDFKICGF